MNSNNLHNIAVWMALFMLPLLAACSSPDYPEAPEAPGSGLYLKVATLSQSRAAADGSILNSEKMSSLRVVVLHQDGKVEHNKYFSLVSSGVDQHLIYLKVKPDENKKVFLFANEESISSVEGIEGLTPRSLTEFFEAYPEDTGGFENAVSSLYFAPDYSDGMFIPMSSRYEVQMGQGYLEQEFYVVRVATKFTINFENWRDETVKVNSFSISSHADKNFLMAHVNNWPQSSDYPSWIDWLRAVTADSNEDGYITSDRDWLKDYDLPTQATNNNVFTYASPVNIGLPVLDAANPNNSKAGHADITPVFYLPESKNIKSRTTDGEQEYTLTLNIEGTEPLSFVLPNLKSLFRNTHVVINISMYTDKVLFRIYVEPWAFGGRTEIDVS